jgi:hypothetical protein
MHLFGPSKRTKRLPAEVAADELNQFLERLRGIEERNLGFVARQVAHVAFQCHRNGICLHEPEKALKTAPSILWTLEEQVIQLKKRGRQVEVPGTMVWVHTLRAVNIPEIRGLAVEMWTYIERSFNYALDPHLITKESMTGSSLDVRIFFLRVPDGFERLEARCQRMSSSPSQGRS